MIRGQCRLRVTEARLIALGLGFHHQCQLYDSFHYALVQPDGGFLFRGQCAAYAHGIECGLYRTPPRVSKSPSLCPSYASDQPRNIDSLSFAVISSRWRSLPWRFPMNRSILIFAVFAVSLFVASNVFAKGVAAIGVEEATAGTAMLVATFERMGPTSGRICGPRPTELSRTITVAGPTRTPTRAKKARKYRPVSSRSSQCTGPRVQ